MHVGKYSWFTCVWAADDVYNFENQLQSMPIGRRWNSGEWVTMHSDEMCLGLTFQWCQLLLKGSQSPVARMKSLVSKLESAATTQYLHEQIYQDLTSVNGKLAISDIAENLTSTSKVSGLTFCTEARGMRLDSLTDITKLVADLSPDTVYVVRLSEELKKQNPTTHMIGVIVAANDRFSMYVPEVGEIVGTRSELPTLIEYYLAQRGEIDVLFKTAIPFAVRLADRKWQ